MNKPRLGISAVIVRDDKILLVEYHDDTALHYNLPCGGVEADESIFDVMRREVLEETHAIVDTVGHMLLAWEYIGVKQDFKYGDFHKVNLVFPCTLKVGTEPRLPPNPDSHQTGIRWVNLDELHLINLIPNIAARLVPLIKSNAIHPVDVIDEL